MYAAAKRGPSVQERPMVDELEETTGLSIAGLAKLTEQWLPKTP